MVISVVLLVYNKRKEASLTLKGFKDQADAGFPWELIIMDDGSTDGTIEAIAAESAGLPLTVRTRPHTGNRNLLRNEGARLATGTRVAFLDGDIIPSRHFLSEHARGKADEVVLGPRLNTRSFPDDPALREALERDVRFLESLPGNEDERAPHFFICPMEKQPHPWRFLHSHNVSVPADSLRRLGSFDPELEFWGADDLELGYRLFRGGLSFRYRARAGGVHLFHPSGSTWEGYRQNLVRFYRKHPAPEIECLAIEHLLKPDQAFQAYEACAAGGFAMTMDPGHRAYLEGKALLLNHVEGAAGKKCVGMGLLEAPEPDSAQICLVSAKLSRLGCAAMLKILESGWTACPQLMIYDPEGEAERNLSPLARWHSFLRIERNGPFLHCFKGGTKVRLALYFPLEHLIDFNMLDDYRDGVVRAMRKREDTLVFSKTALYGVKRWGAFLPACDEEEKPSLPEFLEEPVFVFARPWQSSLKAEVKNAIAVHYENVPERSKGPETYRELESAYDLVFLPCQAELEDYRKHTGGKTPAFVLPFGIDTGIFRTGGKPRNGAFEIMFVSRYPARWTGIETLINAYLDAFSGEDAVRLSILVSPHLEIEFTSPYLNDQHNQRITRWANTVEAQLNKPIESFARRSRQAIANPPEVEVERIDLSQEALAERLRRADLLVEPCLLEMVPANAIRAVACGTRAVVPDHLLKYLDGLEAGIRGIPTRICSSHLHEFEAIPPIDPGPRASLATGIMREIDRDDLARALRLEFEEWLNGPAEGFAREETSALAGKKHDLGRVTEAMFGILAGAAARRQDPPGYGLPGN